MLLQTTGIPIIESFNCAVDFQETWCHTIYSATGSAERIPHILIKSLPSSHYLNNLKVKSLESSAYSMTVTK